ncbi:hypothetical protein L873DRAFT_1846481 [Choiromyces venosus 120613-1]|uniref:CBM6 domain-containing protein n=1 Tax=Choiromyces venosus 120613-1 TaxID=1336337 RepID=A0A3N4JCP1_9PEZI|nr:hypothetical protein L873DRAFT_1846481 [Choiromyces venosus 120613-1]
MISLSPRTAGAEAATLTGVSVATASAGYSGTGYVDGFDESTDKMTFTLSSTAQKLYDLSIRYLVPSGAEVTRVVLNGGTGGDVSLAGTGATTWATVSAGQVLLNAGSNTITIQSNWGWYLIDAIYISPSAARGPRQVTEALVNSNATPAAKEPAMVTWVEQNVGKTPAMIGPDLIDYSPSRVERGTTSTAVEDAIAFDKRGGIVALCWHWNATSRLIDTEGKEWWRGFYTHSVTFDISAALADTTNANYQLLIRDIDAIVVQLRRLADTNVPILWRPLHEAEAGDHGPLSSQYNALLALGNDKKLIATAEVGSIPDLEGRSFAATVINNYFTDSALTVSTPCS